MAHYKATKDHTVLAKIAEELRSTYPSSVWASKAIPWPHWQSRVSMTDEIVLHRGTTMVRRLRLAPSEAMPWHHDPFQRVAVVLQGDVLSIEYRDGGVSQRVEVTPGQVDWEEPTERIHRAVNVGRQPYEQVTVFLLDHPDAVPQPTEE